MMRRHETGLTGEKQAEDYLVNRGMNVLARRYRAQDGEIDLVMQDGDFIVFVEVKARPASARGAGVLAVTPAKQRRMTHAALDFLVQREWLTRPVRFDVVEISAQGILYIPNAFQAARN